MASSTRGGKRGRKKVNMRPTKSGGQIYMSDDYAKEFNNTYAGDTDLQKLIDKKMTERMHAGEMTPKESGSMKSDIFIDQVDESVRKKYAKKKPVKKAEGGAVRGYKCGGKVQNYEGGGAVCRGGRSAMGGTKFRGVR